MRTQQRPAATCIVTWHAAEDTYQPPQNAQSVSYVRRPAFGIAETAIRNTQSIKTRFQKVALMREQRTSMQLRSWTWIKPKPFYEAGAGALTLWST